jgi:uncharacterized lipoprotein
MNFEPARRGLMVVAVIAASVALSGCHHLFKNKACHNVAKQPYMAAKSSAPLNIPPGLDAPDTTNALKIPRLNEPELPARKGQDPCLDEPPAFAQPKPAKPQA